MRTVSAVSVAAALMLASSGLAIAQSSGGAAGGAGAGAAGGMGSSTGTVGAPPSSTNPSVGAPIGGWSPPMAPGTHLNNSLGTTGSSTSSSSGSSTRSDNPMAGTNEVPGNGIGPNPPNIDSSVGNSGSGQ